MAVVTLMASVAIVCWVPMFILNDEEHPGGMFFAVGMGALGILGLALFMQFSFEALRLRRLYLTETRWEWHREVRPKL